jgi:anti-sigma regulatory factor (Ser/Thr protein kinase)
MNPARSFEHGPASIPAARRFATEALAGASPELLETVPLLVSELATNCIRHTDSGFDLTVSTTPGGIRVEVTDHGVGDPHVRIPELSDPSGRGLQIVEMFATTWGVERHGGRGKTVWFTLEVPAPLAAAG